MGKMIKSFLLFDTKDKAGVFSQWMQYQKFNARAGHTLITTFDIDYEFVSKVLNGLFYNNHECTILRSGFQKITDTGDVEVLNNINIYPYRKNKKTHAKAIISVSNDGEPKYFIALGSANTTSGGLGGGNLELIEVFSNFNRLKKLNPISKSIKEYLIESFLPVISDELTALPKNKIDKIISILKKVKGKTEWPKIIDNQKDSLLTQIVATKTKGRGLNYDDLHILSPYHGTTINLFNDQFFMPKWIIGNNEKILKVSKNKYDYYRINNERFLHAKAYIIKQSGTYEIYYGSANCSENALCKTIDKNGGQLEILMTRKITRSEYIGMIGQYIGEKAKFESFAEKIDFKEDDGDNSQLLCINIVTKQQSRFVTLITAKSNIKKTINISADQAKWLHIKHTLLNKEIKINDFKILALLFETENLKWIYQKIGKDIFPVPINYEGFLSYNTDVNNLEDEIIYYLSKKPTKGKKHKKVGKIKSDLDNYSSLTHESALDLWFKKIRIIKKLLPPQDIIEKLIKSCRHEKYKHEFLKGYFGNNK